MQPDFGAQFRGTDDQQKALRERLWQAVLAECERIKSEENPVGGTSRKMAYYADGWPRCATLLTIGRADGTTAVFFIEATGRQPGWSDPDRIDIHVSRSYHSSEDYWERQITDQPERRVVVGGVHYRLGQHGARPSDHNGFGGKRWDIEFTDGRKVTTHDLWYQGLIPPKFRDRLPDNARFVEATAAA
jgi:hypothetical protein